MAKGNRGGQRRRSKSNSIDMNKNYSDEEIYKNMQALQRQISDLNKKRDERMDKMIMLNMDAREAESQNQKAKRDAIMDQYYKLQKQNNKDRDKLTKLESDYAKWNKKRTEKEESSRPYINGYGEATTREITSLSYERAKKRADRNFDKWFRR